MKVTNISRGPRGFWHNGRMVDVEPGATVDLDLSPAERKAAERTGQFGFGEAAAKRAAQGQAAETATGLTPEAEAKLRTEIEAKVRAEVEAEMKAKAEAEAKAKTGASQ